MTRLVVVGAGRMGRALVETAAARDATVVAVVSRSPVGETTDTTADPDERRHTDATDDTVDLGSHGHVDGRPVTPVEALGRLLRERDVDAVVEFSAPAGTVTAVERAADAGVPVVSGTTGLAERHREAVAAAAERVPVVRATNFSRGIAALRRAAETVAAALPGYDVEVTETHHDGKRDAPSGTVEALVAAVTAQRPELTDRTHGRVGDAPRTTDEIGVHARRAGDVAGEHELLFAGDDQTLRLTHRAGSRRVFAAGALDAARWVVGRPPGSYAFDDVIGFDVGNGHAANDPSGVSGVSGTDGVTGRGDGGATDETDDVSETDSVDDKTGEAGETDGVSDDTDNEGRATITTNDADDGRETDG